MSIASLYFASARTMQLDEKKIKSAFKWFVPPFEIYIVYLYVSDESS